MKKSITRLLAILLAIGALIAFVGCDLTGTESFDSSAESRKGKPAPAVPVSTPVYDGVEGPVLDLAPEDYIETYYTEDQIFFTPYNPVIFTPYDPIIFTPYDPAIFTPYSPVTFTPYDPIVFTEYNPELYFYFDGENRVFVPENDPAATHFATGYNTTGFNTTGFNTTGFNTIGFNTIGFNTIGERIVGWESTEYGLWAGQDNDAGTVTISNDNENFYINIDTNSSADLQEVHIYVYEDEASLPEKRPAPGQAPYTVENVLADSVEVVIPIDELVNLDDYFFIIHAALVSDAEGAGSDGSNAGETAYAAGDDAPDFSGKGAWFYVAGFTPTAVIEYITEDVHEDVTVEVQEDVYVDVYEDVYEELESDDGLPEGSETAFGVVAQFNWFNNSYTVDERFSHDFLDYGFNRWGWTNGPYTGGGNYMQLIAGAGQSDINKGTKVGNVFINPNYATGTLDVSFIQDSSSIGYDIVQTHVYVGTEKFPDKNGNPTVAPGQYTSVHSSVDEFTPIPFFVFNPIDTHRIPWDYNNDSYYIIVHATVVPNGGSGFGGGGFGGGGF